LVESFSVSSGANIAIPSARGSIRRYFLLSS
jgi:hypothetical protein